MGQRVSCVYKNARKITKKYKILIVLYDHPSWLVSESNVNTHTKTCIIKAKRIPVEKNHEVFVMLTAMQ